MFQVSWVVATQAYPWGNDPIWQTFSKWVGSTTNWVSLFGDRRFHEDVFYLFLSQVRWFCKLSLQWTNVAGWERHHLKMYLLLKLVVFHCYVCLLEGILFDFSLMLYLVSSIGLRFFNWIEYHQLVKKTHAYETWFRFQCVNWLKLMLALEVKKFQCPMTDPWDERYIYLHEHHEKNQPFM